MCWHASTTTGFVVPPPCPQPSASFLLQLPDPALPQAVLQQLSTRDVLSAARSCSQLCWTGSRPNPARLTSLLLYLEHYGQQVISLEVADSSQPTRLPASCSRLQTLSFAGRKCPTGRQ